MKPRRAPFVAVRTDLVKDERVSALGDLAGYNVYEARGRLVTLWSWCVDRRLLDAPADSDGYAVSESVVRRFMGPRGVEAMLGDGCDELALAVRRHDGLLYLRGTGEYVTSLRGLAATARAGGSARASGTRDDAGRYRGDTPRETTESVVETTIVQPSASREPAADQPESSRHSSRSHRTTRNQKPLDLERPEEIPASRSPAMAEFKATVEKATRSARAVFQPAVDAFDQYFRKVNNGSKPTWGGKRIAMIERLVKSHNLDEVIRRIGVLSRAPPSFPPQPWDLPMFVQHFDKCAQETTAKNTPRNSVMNSSPTQVALDELARLEREAQLRGGP